MENSKALIDAVQIDYLELQNVIDSGYLSLYYDLERAYREYGNTLNIGTHNINAIYSNDKIVHALNRMKFMLDRLTDIAKMKQLLAFVAERDKLILSGFPVAEIVKEDLGKKEKKDENKILAKGYDCTNYQEVVLSL